MESYDTNENDWQTSCIDLKEGRVNLFGSDCTLLVGREPNPTAFKGHKLILSRASPIFEDMFSESKDDVFRFEDCEPKPFQVMLNYVYTENINIDSYELARDVFLCASEYQVLHLARVCSTYMAYNVTVENACDAFEMGVKFNDVSLMNEAAQLIKDNIQEILNQRNFITVDINSIVWIFSISNLKIKSEMQLFQALELYVTYSRSLNVNTKEEYNENVVKEAVIKDEVDNQNSINCPTDHTYKMSPKHPEEKVVIELDDRDRTWLRPALAQIRFLTMTPLEFAKNVALSPLLCREDAFALLANIASPGAVPMPEGFTTIREPRCEPPSLVRPLSPPPQVRVFRLTVPNIARQRHSLKSPPFHSNGLAWSVKMLPRHTRYTSSFYDGFKMTFGFFLRCESPKPAPWSGRAHVTFRLLSPKPAIVARTMTVNHTFTSEHRDCGFSHYVTEMEAHEYMFPEHSGLIMEVHIDIPDVTNDNQNKLETA